ncbi:hypothetical protein OAN90_04285, partial [Gammaproteobacteria bacterium]|nr:hypothetical protein [Gammaproteobacteria bacterium]
MIKNATSYLKENALKILIFIITIPIILIFIFYSFNKSNIYYSDIISFKDNSFIDQDIDDYDSKNIIDFEKKLKGEEKNFRIKFKFHTNHPNKLQNLFQTDDGNTGIRLEIQKRDLSIISSEG